MDILVFAILLGVIPAAIAKAKGHSFFGWWIYGTLLLIVALPHSIVLKAIQENIDQAKLADGMRKCPYCAEIVRQEAIVCRYCNRDLPPDPELVNAQEREAARQKEAEKLKRINDLSKGGILITEAPNAPGQTQLKAGDVVIAVNDQDVRGDIDRFTQLVTTTNESRMRLIRGTEELIISDGLREVELKTTMLTS